MDDIIRMVSERIGIPPDKARSAVEIVVSQLKSRLPGQLGSQLDSALSGGAGGADEGIADKLGGMVGGGGQQPEAGGRPSTRR